MSELLPEYLILSSYKLNFVIEGLLFTGSTTYQPWSFTLVSPSKTYSTTLSRFSTTIGTPDSSISLIINSPSSVYSMSGILVSSKPSSISSTTYSTTSFSTTQLTLTNAYNTFDFTITYRYSSVIQMLQNILQFNGIPAVYMADVKNVQVRANNPSAVFVMDEVSPVLYWHNWADEYNFTLQIYNLKPSIGVSPNFQEYDEIVKRDIMYDVINSKLITGGTVVGYNATSNWLAMKQKRGITYVEYKIKILVVYSS